MLYNILYIYIFTSSYISRAVCEAGAVAQHAEQKLRTYNCLESFYLFTPVAIETSGDFGPLTRAFLRDLCHRMCLSTGDNSSLQFLIQRLSVIMQRGNAASVMGSLPSSIPLVDDCYLSTCI